MTEIIDEERLAELERDFGSEDLWDIIEAFLEEATEVVDAIGGLLSDGPHEERAGQFHFLAGAARNLGASAFGDLCKRLETQNQAFTADDYAAFREAYGAVLAHFDAMRGGGAVAAAG